jgi:hypothetical protein
MAVNLDLSSDLMDGVIIKNLLFIEEFESQDHFGLSLLDQVNYSVLAAS